MEIQKNGGNEVLSIKLNTNLNEKIEFLISQNGHIKNQNEIINNNEYSDFTPRFKISSLNSSHGKTGSQFIVNINGLYFYDLNDIPIESTFMTGQRLKINEVLNQIKKMPPIITLRKLNDHYDQSGFKNCSQKFVCKIKF